MDFGRIWNQQVHTTIPPLPATLDLSSKTILITGASTGLGYECALQLLQAKAGRLILPVRNLPKGQAARTKLLNDSIVKAKNPNAKIELFSLEMEDFESVVALPVALRQAGILQLDIAIMNAGLRNETKIISKSGHEGTLQVNHLSTLLLSILLLPLLRAGSKPGYPSTLSIVNSSSHDFGAPQLTKFLASPNIHAALNNVKPENYEPQDYYNMSKLISQFVSRELAARVSVDKVVVNTLCPGFCKSDLARNMNPILVTAAKPILYLMMRSTKDGGRCLCLGALAGKESHGGFWNHNKLQDVAPMIVGKGGAELQKRLWDESMGILRLAAPRLGEIIRID